MDRLTAEVRRNTSVDDSIITLVQGIAQRLRDMTDSATELTALKAQASALADELEQSSDRQAQAVQENTENVPTPPPSEPPTT